MPVWEHNEENQAHRTALARHGRSYRGSPAPAIQSTTFHSKSIHPVLQALLNHAPALVEVPTRGHSKVLGLDWLHTGNNEPSMAGLLCQWVRAQPIVATLGLRWTCLTIQTMRTWLLECARFGSVALPVSEGRSVLMGNRGVRTN